ncbi:Hypothetical predicted protein [Cloeon dipterum]|uniref:NADH dehydrogenase [ubiquinone] flavoprotein 3, mitochondrial n=1 Tax=Cloeon dipterum TaxID=197152 RepID=A0A8S1DYV2_9INSE|nr:Hypothetical predicted protein [Cloeon dipterum]
MASRTRILSRLISPARTVSAQIAILTSEINQNSQDLLRGMVSQAKSPSGGPSSSIPNVQGLSAKCLKVPNEPVGPGAKKDGAYKNPEYYCYNDTSYFEAEIEMAKYRIPQPSNKK